MSTPPPLLRCRAAELRLIDCRTRLPFRFGIHTMRAAPLAVLRASVEMPDGTVALGYASDLLVPKWFEKVAERSVVDDWRGLIGGIRQAVDAACSLTTPMTTFSIWRTVEQMCADAAPGPRAVRLLVGHGPSLVERAVIDALCRWQARPFVDVVHANVLGLETGSGPGLDALGPPSRSMSVRHTIGLVDPITAADVGPDAPNDGLPVALADIIATYGVHAFKIKVCGDPAADRTRLGAIARLLRAHVPDALCTLDGNEQFESIAVFAELLARLDEEPDTAWLRGRIVRMEQPLPRARTFDVDANRGLADLGVPVIIDEADGDPQAFADAVALGYRGVSVKNCKGVHRALAGGLRCRASGGRLIQSAEDLTNLPLLALQQDLATSAVLGLGDIERNGHHYFAGLAHLAPSERAEAVERHPDLYAGAEPHLRIDAGRLGLDSVLAAPGYGYAGAIEWNWYRDVDTWWRDSALVAEAREATHG